MAIMKILTKDAAFKETLSVTGNFDNNMVEGFGKKYMVFMFDFTVRKRAVFCS